MPAQSGRGMSGLAHSFLNDVNKAETRCCGYGPICKKFTSASEPASPEHAGAGSGRGMPATCVWLILTSCDPSTRGNGSPEIQFILGGVVLTLEKWKCRSLGDGSVAA